MADFQKSRKKYEGELVDLLMEDTKCLAEPAGKTQGWDVLLFLTAKRSSKPSSATATTPVICFEVKTSKHKKVYLNASKRTRLQLKRYRGLRSSYGVPTVYAFRHVSMSRKSAREKWRFIPVDSMTRKGTLDFQAGITYKEMIRRIKHAKKIL